MERIKQARPSPSLIIAVLALAAALTGTAVAVTALNNKEKQQVRKIAKRLDKRAVKSIPAGEQGPAGPPGSEGPPGPAGSARAYGLVSDAGLLTRSQGVTAVTHPDTGIYCIALDAGIDPDTAVLVVAPDSSDNETSNGSEDESYVEWNSEGTDCPTGALEVFTYLYNGDSVDDDDGGGNTTGDNLASDDESFVLLVP